MQCPRCKFHETRYDTLTKMWFCPKCNNLWDGPAPEVENVDVEPEIDTNLVKQVMEEEEEFDEDYDEDDEEFWDDTGEYTYEIGFASASVLAILLLIPGINIVAYLLILQSDYKDSIKNVYAGLMISNILAIGLLIIGLIYGYNNNYMPVFRDKCVDIVADITMDSFKEHHIFKREDFHMPVNYDRLAHNTPVESFTIVDEVKDIEERLTYLDASIVSGATVKMIMEDYKQEEVCYLIRTNAMTKKNGNNQWVNYGTIVSTAEVTDAGTYFVNQTKIMPSYTYYTNEYEDTKFAEWDVINDTKYIFQVKDSSLFLCNLLYNDEKEFVGFAFTEQE